MYPDTAGAGERHPATEFELHRVRLEDAGKDGHWCLWIDDRWKIDAPRRPMGQDEAKEWALSQIDENTASELGQPVEWTTGTGTDPSWLWVACPKQGAQEWRNAIATMSAMIARAMHLPD